MTTADEQLRKLLAAHAPRRTTTAAAPTPIDDEGAAAAARAELRRQRPASRTDAPAETLESALSQGSARALAAALARMPASGAATEAQRADCRKLLALRPLPLDRYAAALAAAAETDPVKKAALEATAAALATAAEAAAGKSGTNGRRRWLDLQEARRSRTPARLLSEDLFRL